MSEPTDAERTLWLLGQLGISRTEITTSHLSAVQGLMDGLRVEPQQHMASEYLKMVKMMREQRDGFRRPRDKHGLGAKHSDEARHNCAELLDWFLINYYDPRPTPKLSFVMASAGGTGFNLDVQWADGERAGTLDVVDMADIVMTRTVMRPLREDRVLWKSVHVIAHGNAIGWGDPKSDDPDDVGMDFGADGLQALAEEQHPYRGKPTSPLKLR